MEHVKGVEIQGQASNVAAELSQLLGIGYGREMLENDTIKSLSCLHV